MKRNPAKWLFIIPVLLFFAIISVFYYTMPVLKIVQDPSWKLLMPKSEIRAFRTSLLKERIRLSVDTLNPDDLTEEQLKKYAECNIVLFSPVMSAFVAGEYDVETVAEGVLTMAIGSPDLREKFTVVLESPQFSVSDFRADTEAIPVENAELDTYSSMVFDNPDGYFTDYRFSEVIPEKYLKGVVCPDLSQSVIPYLQDESELQKEGKLVYGYRKIR